MGRAKEKYLSDDDAGYNTGRSLNVCSLHFGDEDIKQYIELYGKGNLKCSFCDSWLDEEEEEDEEVEVETKSITWDMLMNRIMPAIRKFYDNPANGLPYESAEGGYQGECFDTEELLQDELGIEADYEVIDEISKTIINTYWTRSNFYADTYLDHLNYTWNSFSKLVKHSIRFFFHDFEESLGVDDLSHKPFAVLNDIGKFIVSLNLFRKVPEKSDLFNHDVSIVRARQHEKLTDVVDCKGLGSAPCKYAGANRFSPEGISIFYGTEDSETAIREIINQENKDEFISIGEFRPTKQLNLIDLRRIPRIGFFNVEKLHLLEPSRFLHYFVENISKKHEKGGQERIEYVPSQIVTEFFRFVLPVMAKQEIHGIIYKSVQNPSKSCYAIFADEHQCSDEGDESEDTVLVLVEGSIIHGKVTDYL